MARTENIIQTGATAVADLSESATTIGFHEGPVAEESLIGQVLVERYHLLEQLGAGGMGTVYLAEHVTIGKRLAIKVLSREFAHKHELVERFLQEARAASMIAHENVVEITDFGRTPDGSVFFVMEHLAGEDLSATIAKEGPLPWSRVKPIALQICMALEAAHAKGVIHRDMKPENCFRVARSSNQDFIKVLDFGIAKISNDEASGTNKGLTKTGMIFGTPEYMSPEQAQGMRVDLRADIYAVGVIVYECLTGKTPFTSETFMGVLTQHMFEAPKAPSEVFPNASITPQVEALILKALQKDRELRFQSMTEMIMAIRQVGTGAAPVDVIQENLGRPQSAGQQMKFATGVDVDGGATIPDGSGNFGNGPRVIAVGKPDRFGAMAIVLAALFIGIAGASLYLLMTSEVVTGVPVAQNDAAKPAAGAAVDPPKDEPTTGPATTGGSDSAASQADLPPEPQAQAATVKLQIHTNVVATVLDARDHGMLGTTNSTGVSLKRGESAVSLVLVADGYKDTSVEVIPDVDKDYTFELGKKKRRGGSGKKVSKKTVKKGVPGIKDPFD